MHQDFPLLVNLSVVLVVALIGGFVARRVGFPSIAGYLAAGVAIGPFTPGFVGDVRTIGQLAELGVIFLMFGVGLHFSPGDLWSVRRVAIPGAIAQTTLSTIAAVALTQFWGWSLASGLVLGLAISVASTVVLLRGLMDRGWLNTSHGQVGVGWLVFEDLATVAFLVLLPAMFSQDSAGNWVTTAAKGIFSAGLFVAIMLLAGTRVVPSFLARVATFRSRELFILTVVALAMGIAVGSTVYFGVSVALGAFLAGVVLGESTMSHQVGVEMVPFRETFSVVFFVSVGMLVNLSYLQANAGPVLILTGLIVIGKALITLAVGLFLPCPARTVLIVAAGLSQIGEFSFIVGQAGVHFKVLTQDQYSLILAGALISILINPLMYGLVEPAERWLKRHLPGFWKRLDRSGPSIELPHEHLGDHVVVIGCGRVGAPVARTLLKLGVPRLVVELDPGRAVELEREGVPALFGDASNSDILAHAGLERARLMVITLPSDLDAILAVTAAREINPELPILVRASTMEGLKRLSSFSGCVVIHPELEGGLELMRHALLSLDYPMLEVQRFADSIRGNHYESNQEASMLSHLMHCVRGIELVWVAVEPGSELAGKSIEQSNLRARTRASVIAVLDDGDMQTNPPAGTLLRAGARIGLIGEAEHLEKARALLQAGEENEAVEA